MSFLFSLLCTITCMVWCFFLIYGLCAIVELTVRQAVRDELRAQDERRRRQWEITDKDREPRA